ncbi:hypothetical protein HKX48_006542, partial [Thoreauomyces humboldtii]
MEVVELRSAHLSNSEVLLFLKEIQIEQEAEPDVVYPGAPPDADLTDLYTVEQEVIQYLEGTPASAQSDGEVLAALKALAPYDLTKAEKLMLINFRPPNLSALQPLIEEIDARLTDVQKREIVSLITTLLPYTDPNEETEEADLMETE